MAGSYLIHDLTVDEVNRTLRLIQQDIARKKSTFSSAPTETILGSPSVASNLASNPYVPPVITYMVNPMTSAGDIIAGTTAGVPIRIPPNTTNNPMFLQSQGDGVNGLPPTWTSNLTVNSFTCSSSISTTTYIYVGLQGTNEQSGVYYYQNVAQTPIVSTSIIDASGTSPTVGNAWMHHHSTVSPATFYASRSNSATTGHGVLTNGMQIFNVTAMGTTQSGALAYEYQPFGSIIFCVDDTGTLSATSAPGKIQFWTTPNGSVSPVLAMTINGSQLVTFVSSIDIATIGQGVKVAEGTNAKQGVSTLTAGTVTVANTSVTATSRIFLTRQGLNASTSLGELAVNSRIAGTSFTITSYTPGAVTTATGDVSTIAWEIFEVG